VVVGTPPHFLGLFLLLRVSTISPPLLAHSGAPSLAARPSSLWAGNGRGGVFFYGPLETRSFFFADTNLFFGSQFF